jgi:hypothetical protein
MLATIGGKAIDVDRPVSLRGVPPGVPPRHVRPPRRDGDRPPPRDRRGLSPRWVLRGGASSFEALAGGARLLAGKRIRKMTFFIHSFMDAECLDSERIRNCAFMVMTGEGPVSMCEVIRGGTTSSSRAGALPAIRASTPAVARNPLRGG